MKRHSIILVLLFFGILSPLLSSKTGSSGSIEKDTTNSDQNNYSDVHQRNTVPPMIMQLINSAEVIVEGHIIETRNLYKKGGTFHTLIILKVDSTYKGNANDKQLILLRFGFTERSHRGFVSGGSKIISLEPGDKGLFFLSRKNVIAQEAAGNEKYKQFLDDKIGFAGLEEEKNVFIIKQNEFDLNYLQMVFPDVKMPTLSEFREELRVLIP